MSPPLDNVAPDRLKKLIEENEKVIVLCFFGNPSHGSERRDGKQTPGLDRSAFDDLLGNLNADVASAYFDLSSNADISLSLLRRDINADGVLSPFLAFFLSGKQIYTVPDTTPWPRISRLVALFHRNPDTLEQLGRQEENSRKQGQQNKASPAARAQFSSKSESGVDGDGPSSVAAEREKRPGDGKEEAGRIDEDESSGERAIRIFVAGDRSQVGKSSTCLGLLGAFMRHGLEVSELAYIKPATQCEKPQLVTKWCEGRGVSSRGIGPVVFYKGFTREFLRGGLGTSEELLQELREAVEDVSRHKKVVVVDGVGYPAVGSICGVSNADVAATLNAPVLLVGKSGVGDAVDSYNLNSCFFEAKGVKVLGGVFNRLSTEGFYQLEKCREAVTSYFSQFQPHAMPYGFVPEIPSLLTPRLVDAGAKSKEESKTASDGMRSSAPTNVGDQGIQEASPSVRATATTGVVTPIPSPSTGESSSSSGDASTETPVLSILPVKGVGSNEELEGFVTEVGDERLVVVDFAAGWCTRCKVIEPFARSLPAKFDGNVAVVTVDVDDAPEVGDAYSVTSIPHFVFLKGGAQVGTYTGSTESELRAMIERHLNKHPAPPATTPPPPPPPPSSSSQADGLTDKTSPEGELKAAEALIDTFARHVDVARLLNDMREYARTSGANRADGVTLGKLSVPTSSKNTAAEAGHLPEGGGVPEGEGSSGVHPHEGKPLVVKPIGRRRKREEIEAEAAELGASSSGG